MEPRPNRLLTLAQLLNVSPAWLLEGQDNLEPTAKRPRLAEIQDQLNSAQQSLKELSGIVEDLTNLVDRKIEEASREAA